VGPCSWRVEGAPLSVGGVLSAKGARQGGRESGAEGRAGGHSLRRPVQCVARAAWGPARQPMQRSVGATAPAPGAQRGKGLAHGSGDAEEQAMGICSAAALSPCPRSCASARKRLSPTDPDLFIIRTLVTPAFGILSCLACMQRAPHLLLQLLLLLLLALLPGTCARAAVLCCADRPITQQTLPATKPVLTPMWVSDGGRGCVFWGGCCLHAWRPQRG